MQLSLIFKIIFGEYLVTAAQTGSTFSPARPPALPLAVKSPYFNTWLPAGSNDGNGGYLPGRWPTFYVGQDIGWTGLIRVDSKTLTWMGAPEQVRELANQTSYEYTSTRSIFKITADDKVELTLTFLSPLTPMDIKRQSLTFSYMHVEVHSLDGAEHDVQIYTDISAEWVSGNSYHIAEWNSNTYEDIHYHKIWNQEQQFGVEWKDQATWGNWYYATHSADGTTYQTGSNDDVRGLFDSTGKLNNSKDIDFRAINDRWPVFAYATDFESVGSKPKSNLFTIGLAQDEAIQFLSADGLRTLSSLWKSYFGDEVSALRFFHNDFENSSKLSKELDDKIWADSAAVVGDDYALLTTLAPRQIFGATQLVGTEDNYYLFLKEISSNGNTQTVDVIYPASPFFFYTNPELMTMLLKPHFENQEHGWYPNKSAMHDLGEHYPNATGHTDGNDQVIPLEECGNMIIMVLAYVQWSGNTDYIREHYPLLKQWSEYLIEYGLIPAHQFSTDDFAGKLANQTNLALKGIIGLEAMSQISKIVGKDADADKFTTIAHDYLTEWTDLGINHAANPPHSTLSYDNMSTHSLLYNLYNDRLLNLNFVPQEIYSMQDTFYPTMLNTYGVPLDTRSSSTKTDWQMFCAAIASIETRDMFINAIVRFVNETPTSRGFTDLYDVQTGQFPLNAEFKARPVQGGLFALLLLDYPEVGYRASRKALGKVEWEWER
ncbi:DUF1793-domain-containing protein [Plenodomus tracheiphilus IPT5]|uniref:DUF1793-domain-containing protein n=1 Tax=Plenodomus tracheiphilus IPT5 TaxID=1408161 RepID=A0A6A7B0L4_9PLEO|nr:DUF1793-domain-containing protein [Plenodomus tracheiphilus IPT5]